MTYRELLTAADDVLARHVRKVVLALISAGIRMRPDTFEALSQVVREAIAESVALGEKYAREKHKSPPPPPAAGDPSIADTVPIRKTKPPRA